MPRMKKFKDEFEDLPLEFKDAVAQSSPDEINARIAETAKSEVDNQRNKADDEQLKEAKAAARMAGEQYRDATKMNKLKIRYAKRVLEDKGKA